MILFLIFVASVLMRLAAFFPLTFTITFSYLRTQFILKISLLSTISLLIKYYQPKQYANYQPIALAFSPIKEQYIITIIITCLEENNGKGQ